jgi:hypothetical protein
LKFHSIRKEKRVFYMKTDVVFFLILYRSFLLRMRNGSDKSCRGNQNTFYGQLTFLSKIVPFMR